MCQKKFFAKKIAIYGLIKIIVQSSGTISAELCVVI